MKGRKKPRPVDSYVGQQIRKIRLLRGMTQTDLAKGVDVEFQQIQKYEVGDNRVSASKMVMIAKALDTTPTALLGKYAGLQSVEDIWDDKRILRMIRAYTSLPVAIQGQIYKLILELEKMPNYANQPDTLR